MQGLAFPEIDPVAISVFGLAIRWYSLAYLAGFLAGWAYALKLLDNATVRPFKNDADDFLPIAVLGVILGGRLGYVLFYNPIFFFENPSEILKVWQGGMSFHGGALGVFIAMIAFSLYRKFSFLRLADLTTTVVPFGLLFGRLANFANGELYGRATDVAWGVRFPAGGFISRHPSQLYEAFLEGLMLLIILFFVYKKFRDKPGVTASCFLIGYGAFRFIIEYFREPDAQYGLFMGFISMGQILSLPMVVVGVILCAIFASRKTSR